MADWTMLNGCEERAAETLPHQDSRIILTRQREDDAPTVRRSLSAGRRGHGEDLVSILASEESFAPAGKPMGCEAGESDRILEPVGPANEETGGQIRRDARLELLRGLYGTEEGNGRNGREQHHVQFNRNILNASEGTKKGATSPSISSASGSSEEEEEDDSLENLAEARAPDGGYGWVVVAAAFMVNLIADGITFSFGVIYHEFLKYFGEGKATTSWIGSLFMAMPLLSGPIASFLTDRYGCRRVTIAGSILATSGFVVSYFATSLEMLILTFGVLAGFGLSLCFVAAVVIVAYYFEKRRSFATGLSVCGSGIGTFIFPPLIQRLLEEYGWRGTTLILSGLFLNLAVCGALMRDLEWTRPKSKLRRQLEEERKQRLRTGHQRSSSADDSFSASSSANTAQTLHGGGCPDGGPVEEVGAREDADKLFSSLVSLPTFVKNGERVPLEVLELLSAKRSVYNVLVQNYPSLMITSRSFSDSSGLHEPTSPPSARFVPVVSPLAAEDKGEPHHRDDKPELLQRQKKEEEEERQGEVAEWWSRDKPEARLRRSSIAAEHPRRFTTAYLKDIRMHRHSLTYRGAMLNINRYRLRASSCPDILRNSMTTIAKEEAGHSGLREFKELIVNIFDLTHFREPVFTLFAMSNFLLHTWYDVPYMYLTDNAIEVGFSETEASYLISVIGIMNMAGEILLGWVGDRACINATVVYAICMAMTGGFAALIPTVIKCYYLLSAIAGAFGFFIAANYSLTSIILVQAITIERFTNAYGLLLFVQGIANLMGPPIAGISVMYGGRVIDSYDRRVSKVYMDEYFGDFLFDAFQPYHFYKDEQVDYVVPIPGDRQSYLEFIESLPLVNTPEVFGLHPNAEIGYFTQATKDMWAHLIDLQPQTGRFT
ncbi:uncharacterized protein LOC106643525 [Copidosoma floridanum]|uniref:uncharacterized protein LOC106643525 n=1 Tax=Copidosoma floridanum TaxID=29053 RepID=UPI000C6FA0F5|nr:uncharacterized protein LOC106643525 [Copidosoma floridanum]